MGGFEGEMSAHASLVPNPWTTLPDSPPYLLRDDPTDLTPKTIDRLQLQLQHLPVPFLGDPRQASAAPLESEPWLYAGC